MLGCSSVAAVEEVAGGWSFDIIGLHAYGCMPTGAFCYGWVRQTGWNVLQATHKSLKRCVARGAARVAS